MNLYDLTRSIIDNIPVEQRFTAEDTARLMAHRDVLLSFEDEMVQGFYDAVEAHGPMAALLGDGNRGEREATLRRWWQRTLAGPIDDGYWAWQALVGVVHIKVGVKNPMMMAMWSWMMGWLRTRLADQPEHQALMGSLERLALTTQSITAESFLMNYLETVIRLTGFKPALLERMFKTEIKLVLAEAREQLGKV